MTGSTYIKQAVIASLCEHPNQDKYRARAFAGDGLSAMTDALAGHGVALTKRDFFTPDENGVYLIDTPGFWANFEKIRTLLAKGNERFDAEDFLLPLQPVNTRTLLQSAIQYKGLGQIFTAPVWTGRFNDMELLWYKVPYLERKELTGADGTIPLPLKRTLLQAEGRVAPEDRLAAAKLSAADIHTVFRERGDFESLSRRLTTAGDYLRKDYLLLLDHLGDTCFASQNAWQRYPQLAETLARHGEQFEVVDFIRQVGSRNNIIARAAEHRALDKVFAPQLWVGRLGDMLTLWNHLSPGWKNAPLRPADFDLAYADAESRTFAPLLDFTALHNKQDLLLPLNGADAQPVLGLGLQAFWAQAITLLPLLAKQGEPVQLRDLRRISGQLGHSCLITAAKCGSFRQVVGIARASGEPLTLEDFMSRDMHDNTLLTILAERKELALVFTPELWAGRLADMRNLWAQVRHADRAQIDMQQVEIAVKQATLKKHSRPGLKIKPR